MQAYENFRVNVNREMEMQGWSVRALAKELETSHPYLLGVLNGKTVPSLERCERIAEILNVPLGSLITKSSKKVPA